MNYNKDELVKYLQTSLFIDDLEEIVFSEELKNQKGILFSRDNLTKTQSNVFISKSWKEISQDTLGNWSLDEVKNMANFIGNSDEVKSIETVDLSISKYQKIQPIFVNILYRIEGFIFQRGCSLGFQP